MTYGMSLEPFPNDYAIATIKKIVVHYNLNIDNKIYDSVEQSRDLDEFCNILVDDITNPDTEKLAVTLLALRDRSRILAANPNDDVFEVYINTMVRLAAKGVISTDFIEKARNFSSLLNNIDWDADCRLSYAAYKSLSNNYLCKLNDLCVETPQFLYARVAIHIHDNDFTRAMESYKLLSDKSIIHASPTLFNSGARRPQLASCFLVDLEDDSLESIGKMWLECLIISAYGGGIGLCLSNIRSKYSLIHSSQKPCKGVRQVMNLLETMALYVDQGGRRPGAISVYFEMTHPEIDEIIGYKRQRSALSSDAQIHDLFFAVWVPDLFMKRVQEDGVWSMFDEGYHASLTSLYGDEYEAKYIELETAGNYVRQTSAKELFNSLLHAQVETGGPNVLFKDTANKLSGQKHVGMIRSSNLCTEILEVSSSKQTAVCNLANINLEKCITSDGTVDYERIAYLTRVLVRNLNATIDKGYYCSNKSKNSNLSLRPIGIGVSGLQALFYELELPFTCDEARAINARIFETMYWNALSESNVMAQERTPQKIKDELVCCPELHEQYKPSIGCYPSFWESPLASGKTHIELYEELTNRKIIRTLDWETLKRDISMYGVVNSLTIALMPTVSTSELLGTTECFEPLLGAIVSRNTLNGNFKIVNRQIRAKLKSKNMWTRETIDSIIEHNGSVQQLTCLTDEEKMVYRLAWEIDPLDFITSCVDRAPFIDQSQSMSCFIESPTSQQLGDCLFYAWRCGLPTGVYYTRSLPVTQQSKFKKQPAVTCDPVCMSCS